MPATASSTPSNDACPGYGRDWQELPLDQALFHQCNCSHSCECAGSVPDKHAECATAWQQTPWPWPLRVRCEDEGLQTACAREATCNAFGRMDNLGKVKEMLGAGMLRKCLDLCRCATITCWGILWF